MGLLSASITLRKAKKDAKAILSTTIMYAISSSGVEAPDSGWSNSVLATTPAQPWLWTRTIITYSEGEPSVSYSVSRHGTDGTNGTSFTPKGEANAHFSIPSEITDKTAGKVYLVDKDDASTPVISAPCVVRFTQGSGGSVLWNSTKAETGDAYMIGAALWVNNGSEWVQFGQIQGPAGEAGEDALVAEVNPNPLMFQTNDKGSISGNILSPFYLRVYCGSNNVTKQCQFSLLTDAQSYSNLSAEPSSSMIYNWSYDETNDRRRYTFNKAIIATDPVSVDNNGTTETYNVARTAGYFTIKCIYGDRVCFAKVQFSVSISAFFQSYIRNDYEMKSEYKSLTTEQGELVKTTSTLRQTAEELTAQVEVVKGDVKKKAGLDIAVTHDENGVIDTNVTLNADMINIDAQHSLDITSDGCFTVSSTNFKLDGYGKVTCTNGNFSGTVNATAGNIGGFRINENFIGSKSGYNMYLTNNRIHFGSESALNNNDGCTVNLGESEGAQGMVTNALDIRSVTGSSHKVNVGGHFSVLANTKDSNYCAAVELQSGWATGAGDIDTGDPLSGNHAIKIDAGDVIGFRPAIRVINKNVTLDDYDYFVFCKNTSAEITITFPVSPKIGQMYMIYQGLSALSFKASHPIVGRDSSFNQSSYRTDWRSDVVGQLNMFVFTGEYWLYAWMFQ